MSKPEIATYSPSTALDTKKYVDHSIFLTNQCIFVEITIILFYTIIERQGKE